MIPVRPLTTPQPVRRRHTLSPRPTTLAILGTWTSHLEDLTIAVGDTVRFEMSQTHNAVEVSEENYNNRIATALEGGFNIGFGETGEVTFTEAGVHFYVCQPHISADMIGTITVGTSLPCVARLRA